MNVKTARSWRGMVTFAHLAREGRMTVTIGRRELLAALGRAVAAWPLAARAQQPAMPMIGFLSGGLPGPYAPFAAAYHRGLKETGYVEGVNTAVEYRWAEGEVDRLPALAAELVRRQVAVIAATGGISSALAAKAATTTIPIIFGVSEDPVKHGLVASLARPGGNATGVNFLVAELGSKQLGLLHELVPAAVRVGLLVNPRIPQTETATRDVAAAASARIGCACARRHLRHWHLDRGPITASEPRGANRVCSRARSGRCRLRRELGAAGRQRHGPYVDRSRHEREVVGAAQRAHANHDKGSRYS